MLDIAAQIAEALEAAHGAGIVHRDIKPGNIFVSPAGQVKVLDFGMARSFSRDDPAGPKDGSTIPGRPIGTVNYMAPERILQMPLDARCDLFSLGVVIYEMATGRLPFAGASPSETVTNILENQPTPLTKLSPERPAQLEQMVWPPHGKARRRTLRNGRAAFDELWPSEIDAAASRVATRSLGRLTRQASVPLFLLLRRQWSSRRPRRRT